MPEQNKRSFLHLVVIVFVLLFSGFFGACFAKKDASLQTDAVKPQAARLASILALFERLSIPAPKLDEGNIDRFTADLESVISGDTDGLLILADKKHFLLPDYEPADLVVLKTTASYTVNKNGMLLRKAAEQALSVMGDAAKKEGITLLASSAYRSYEYQKGVYERNVRQMGKEAADRESAMPGASQHQLGTVVDFGSITDEFAETRAGKWLTQNAYKYGFSLSFPAGYENVTGYRWESWHYRYVGIQAAALQKAWFNDIQQYMLEFIAARKTL